MLTTCKKIKVCTTPFFPSHESKQYTRLLRLRKIISFCSVFVTFQWGSWCNDWCILVPVLLKPITHPENPQVQVFMGETFPCKRRCNKAHTEQRDPCLFCCKIKYHANHISKRRDKETGIPEPEDVILENNKIEAWALSFYSDFASILGKTSSMWILLLTVSRSDMKEEMKKKTPKLSSKFSYSLYILQWITTEISRSLVQN